MGSAEAHGTRHARWQGHLLRAYLEARWRENVIATARDVRHARCAHTPKVWQQGHARATKETEAGVEGAKCTAHKDSFVTPSCPSNEE